MGRTTPPRRGRRRAALACAAAIATTLAIAGPGSAGAAPPAGKDRWDHRLRSTPENLVLGGFPIGLPPAITVKSGETVRIDTLSQRAATNPDIRPEDYFGALGVKPEEILPDLKRFWETLPDRESYGPHIMTGPVYVEGAEPGDMLQIDVIDLDTRVPYGVNGTSATGGVFGTAYPGWRPGDVGLDIPPVPAGALGGLIPDVTQHLYRTGMSRGREVAFFGRGIEIPLQPFMGVMAVAPADGMFVGRTETEQPPDHGVQGSGPPGPFGGNLDVNDLTEGSTLYLPVFQPGGQFFTGDAHSVQGDGEVSGSAIEHSLSGTFRFTLHKDAGITGPWAEDKDHWIMMGIDWDLNRAQRLATQNVVDFLVEEKGFTVPKALSFASIAVDFQNAEVVDGTQVVVGKIPKRLLRGTKK